MAGGTGGHLFPGIAIAEELHKRGEEVYFVSGTRKIERHILKKSAFPHFELEVEGFIGRSLKDKLRATIKLILSFFKSLKLIKEIKPAVMVAEGGYVSVPVVLAGKILGVKAVLQEQNVYPGRANLLLSRFVDKIFVGFADSIHYFPKEKVIVSGTPVRSELLEYKERIHQGKGLLLLGGSLGARFLNNLMLKIAKELLLRIPNLYIFHQTGHEDYERVWSEYKEKFTGEQELERLKVYPFIEDMGWAYAQADLVISRAGASTIAELIALKKPAILIPYPYATHHHQERNALVLTKSGSALMFRQEEIREEDLIETITNLLEEPRKLQIMRENLSRLIPLEPKAIIIEETLKLFRRDRLC